jgi:hypothetical protein
METLEIKRHDQTGKRQSGNRKEPRAWTQSRPRVVSEFVSASPDAPSRARRLIERLEGQAGPTTLARAGVLVAELVASSSEHASFVPGDEPISVIAWASQVDACLRVEVKDRDDRLVVSRDADADSRRRVWGLFLVDQLASSWGIERDGGATLTWFELPLAEAGTSWNEHPTTNGLRPHSQDARGSGPRPWDEAPLAASAGGA